jgi:predicted RNase H-like HicB family nuclease
VKTTGFWNTLHMETAPKLTIVIEEGDDGWFIGHVLEVKGVVTQGKSIAETRENLLEALELIFECNREDRQKDLLGKEVLVEELAIETQRSDPALKGS